MHEAGREVLLIDADPGGAKFKYAAEAFDGTGSTERWPSRVGFPFEAMSAPSRDLHKLLPRLAGDFDLTVIDSPPIEDRQGIAISALRAADLAVIPVAPTIAEVDRMAPGLAVIEDVEPLRTGPLPICVLLNRKVAGAASTGEAIEELTRPGHRLPNTHIRRLEIFTQSHSNPVEAADAFAEIDALTLQLLDAPTRAGCGA
ncbi:hypothetical protein [Actinomadura kijaniata]|uniref:hypothetical protein n=1 Tax=Actinomadura kijaniata TaxID=46161 RepID=UPI0012FBBE40|nr:hypothetical protein [Actinomadura kijaniata]